jgi:hypothetical protein
MRWSLPNPEEVRVVKRFAWLPTKLTDNTVVWLESFYVYQRWVCYSYSGVAPGTNFAWKTFKHLKNPDTPDTGGNNIKL